MPDHSRLDKLIERWEQLVEQDEFVSTSTLEIDEAEAVIQINDFPVPSTWVMRRWVFGAVGPFDPVFKHHPDTEWLGRLGETKTVYSRAHLLEALPIGIVVFPGPGISANLADKALKMGISVSASPATAPLRRRFAA